MKPKMSRDIEFVEGEHWFTRREHGNKLITLNIGSEELRVISITGKYSNDSTRLHTIIAYLSDLVRYETGTDFIQDIFPYLTDIDREWIKTGIDFDYMFNHDQPEFV